MTYTHRSTTQRLWEKVEVQPNGCWLFTGAVDEKGYGHIRVDGQFGQQQSMRAHRASYMAFIGDIPEGMSVLHHCDTPRCVFPGHLFAGFQTANVADMRAKGRNDEYGHKKRRREREQAAA